MKKDKELANLEWVRWAPRFLAAFLVYLICTPVYAQMSWVSAQGGVIPSGAIKAGHEADGRDLYICRALYERGVHVGKVGASLRGCNIGFGGREVTIASYEVAVVPAIANRARIAIDPQASRNRELTRVIPAATLPSIKPQQTEPVSVRRGFDEQGAPFVEETMPDGTVNRTLQNGKRVTKPDGSSQFYPFQHTMAQAQPPTPPELPSDPRRGLDWMERHSEVLLLIIQKQVANDERALDSYQLAEKKYAGSNLFKRIEYRTQTAEFLATK